jgi:integrase
VGSNFSVTSENLELFPFDKSGTIPFATPQTTGQKRGPVVKRRFQKGCLQFSNDMAYTFYYEDCEQPDGSLVTRKVRHPIGRIGPDGMSKLAARREHDRIMQEVNRKRGSVAPAIKGRAFGDLVAAWRTAVAPNLSPATVRQRESYLRQHIIPKFGDAAPHSLDVSALQQFATDLRKTLSRKTVVNVLGTIFVILEYARRCGTLVSKVSFSDIEFGTETSEPDAAFFTREQATRIVAESEEPYKTMFAVAWITGLRAGELLALGRADLDFEKKTIRVNKSSDDNTRQIRQPKTKNSTAMLPMPSALETLLRNYLEYHWKPNSAGLLFPNRKGTHPRWRDNVVKYGLKPVLRKLGIPDAETGLHAFRHGLATELAEAAVPIPVLQQQMRHADVRTTLKVYAHAIPQSQRDAMERIGHSISTNVLNNAESAVQVVSAQ